MISIAKIPKKKKLNSKSFDIYQDFICQSKSKIFIANVFGDSMVESGINCGDKLIVQIDTNAESGDIILAEINGKITVKRLKITAKHKELIPANPNYSKLRIKDTDSFKIRGKVCAVIRKY